MTSKPSAICSRARVGLSILLLAGAASGVACSGDSAREPAVVVRASSDTVVSDPHAVRRLFTSPSALPEPMLFYTGYRLPVHRFYRVGPERITTDAQHTFSLGEIVDAKQLNSAAVAIVVVCESPFGIVQQWIPVRPPVSQSEVDPVRVPIRPTPDAPVLPDKADLVPNARAFEVVGMPWEFVSGPVTIPNASRLEFSYATEGFADTNASLQIVAEDESGTQHPVWETTMTTEGARWTDAVAPLDALSGMTVRFVLRTDAELDLESNPPRWTQPMWGSPLLLTSTADASEPEWLPNVIVVSLDTLRADHLGTYGYDRPTSPNIDRFAESAVLFEEAFAPASWTLPSHAAMFSGLHPTQQPRINSDFYTLPDAVDMIAESAAEAGYLTAAFTEGGLVRGDIGFAQGFDRYEDGLRYAGNPVAPSAHTFGNASAWLETHHDVPFFLFVHTYEVHDPYEPIEPYRSQFAPEDDPNTRPIDRYDGEIAHTDFQLGKFLETIERLGLSENTVVIVTSDHGEEFGEHGDTLHMKSVYREVLHVPLIIRMPGIEPGRVLRDVSITDLYATLLDIMRIEGKPTYESESLLPFLGDSGSHSSYARELVPSNLRNLGERVIIVGAQTPEWKYILRGEIEDDWVPSDAAPSDALERNLLETVIDTDSSVFDDTGEQLFDMRLDPAETVDLASEQPEVARTLRVQIRDYLDAIDAEKPGFGPLDEREPLTSQEREDLEALGYL